MILIVGTNARFISVCLAQSRETLGFIDFQSVPLESAMRVSLPA